MFEELGLCHFHFIAFVCLTFTNFPLFLSPFRYIELEQQYLKELEAQRSRLDQEASAKLAELNNRYGGKLTLIC